MPIIVDHETRRTELIEVAIDLIVERGLEGASVRAIAARAGFSAVVVQHYFRNKDELLRLAFERSIELLSQHVSLVLAGSPTALDALEIFLPADPLASRTWRVFFAFWGIALSSPEHAQAQARRGREGREIVKRVLDECGSFPDASSKVRDFQASSIVALLAGIASMATFDPEGWNPELQRKMLAAQLTALGGLPA